MYYYNIGQYSSLLRLFWESYSDAIIKAIALFKQDEKVAGYSCKQYVIQQYQLAFELALLVLYYSNVLGYTYAQTYIKLDIETKAKNLACNGIIWNDILEALDINTNEGDGINFVEEESSFIVGPNTNTTPLTQIDVVTWRTNKQNCVNLL